MAPSPEILVRGAGVAGLVSAVSLAERGAHVTLSEIGDRVGAGASWMAGGMLAPWCEAESAPDIITQRSVSAVEWWKAHVPDTIINGSLVVAPPRDTAEWHSGRSSRRRNRRWHEEPSLRPHREGANIPAAVTGRNGTPRKVPTTGAGPPLSRRGLPERRTCGRKGSP